jgi:hypothetical protein
LRSNLSGFKAYREKIQKVLKSSTHGLLVQDRENLKCVISQHTGTVVIVEMIVFIVTLVIKIIMISIVIMVIKVIMISN